MRWTTALYTALAVVVSVLVVGAVAGNLIGAWFAEQFEAAGIAL